MRPCVLKNIRYITTASELERCYAAELKAYLQSTSRVNLLTNLTYDEMVSLCAEDGEGDARRGQV